MTSVSNAAAIANAVVGLRSMFLLKRRGMTLVAESVVLEMLEDKEDSWFESYEGDSAKVKWMRRVHPRVDYAEAPWTVVTRQTSQSIIHTSRKAYTFRWRFCIPYAFLWSSSPYW